VKVRQPLLPRFVLFVAGVVATLSVGALLITRTVTRSGLEDLFLQRLEQAERVLEQYARSRRAARAAELESVLTSPRFLAAVETGDPATLAETVPSHGLLLASDLVLVTDEEGRTLYASPGLDEATLRRARDLPVAGTSLFLAVDGGTDVREVLVAPLVANNGAGVGKVVLGEGFGAEYAEELRALTGFEVLVANGSRILARSSGLLPRASVESLGPLRDAPLGDNVRVGVAGGQALVHRVADPESGVSVTFVGSVDEAIAPIMSRVSRLLLVLAAAGAALAIGVVYAFASRRVGRQVASLARSAERIAGGDLDHPIRPQSEDELGYVAGEFEKMRVQLRAIREEVETAHAAQVNSERLAAVGRMATGIIHDFKNPMAVVLGTADLIRMRDAGNEKLARQCDVIRRQIERMSALTRDVLEYSRGRTVLEPEEIELGAWLDEIVEGQREASRLAGQRLELDGDRGVRVIVDPGRLRRVVDNLLTNAREASRVGDTVRIAARAPEDGEVLVDVIDEGPGIPPEIAATLFEPFVTAGKDGGSGLGLAISRKIVEDHGATLTVESTPGAGARFRIALPAKLRAPRREGRTEREEVGAT